MKSVGVTHYFALKRFVDSGVKPKRSIHLFVVPDEEVGGFKGTGQFVQTKEFENLNVGFVLDEAIPSESEKELFVKISEKRVLHLKFTSKGVMGHASRLLLDNAVHDLIACLSGVTKIYRWQICRNIQVYLS
jgi:aminoacylase